MCHNFNTRMMKGARPAQSRLTEENLRLHSFAQVKDNRAVEEPIWARLSNPYDGSDDDLDESDNGDLNTRRNNMALRRAASLEALKAYGGCFVSGFLTMQDPLPWASRIHGHGRSLYEDVESLELQMLASDMTLVETGSVQTTSSTALRYAGSPRPDSDTLSQADMEDVRNRRKWSWRSIGRRRRSEEHAPTH